MSALRRQLNRWLLNYRYRLERTHHPQLFAILLASYLERNQGRASFLQIGANDGVRFDPLHEFINASRYQFRGVLVEPVPRLYAALEQIYAHRPGITPINVAVHNTHTSASLFAVREACEASLPEWVRGIASFDRQHLNRPELPADCIEEIKVPCRSVADIVLAYDLTPLDLLQIDTEGYDAEIIRNLDFSVCQPAIIHFEHGLPDQVMTDAAFSELRQLLNSHGYQVLTERYDAIAIRHDVTV
ncbi:MAG: FkbM family methyltransferase [Marinobacter sp.]|uniref:FkbM family methyltransferase n=1 Tax=Marinobacter sp. TaxID=50741 RepID=UPI00299EC329|nr:FkbM family methyltransferase [Marinobacter sp.]MDX1634985.1 FkbM family methyltransferase [Marinobacter sp.]